MSHPDHARVASAVLLDSHNAGGSSPVRLQQVALDTRQYHTSCPIVTSSEVLVHRTSKSCVRVSFEEGDLGVEASLLHLSKGALVIKRLDAGVEDLAAQTNLGQCGFPHHPLSRRVPLVDAQSVDLLGHIDCGLHEVRLIAAALLIHEELQCPAHNLMLPLDCPQPIVGLSRGHLKDDPPV